MKITTTIAAAVLAALFLAACGAAPADEIPDVSDPEGDPDPSLTWTVEDCEGDAPILCVMDGDRVVGTVEYLQFPAEGETDLRARAADYYDTFEEDRGHAYGDDHTFTAFEPRDVTVGGQPGLRYGFTVTASDGLVAERHVIYATVRGDSIHVVGASGYDMGTEFFDFVPTELQLFEPRLDALVAERPLPADEDFGESPALLGDGEHLGYLRLVDLDMGVLMLDLVKWVNEETEDLPEFWIDDPDDTAYLARLSPQVAVTVVDCSTACEQVGTTIGELAGGAVTPFNGEHALFDVVVAGGLVTSVDERYLP
jgi:hypothetical protein